MQPEPGTGPASEPAFDTAPTATGDPVWDVSALIRAVSTQTDRYTDTVRRVLGMHASDLTALTLVADRASTGQAMTASELAAELHLSPSAVTSLIDRLERVGHVHRSHHAQDGRKVVLDMTEQASVVSRAAFMPLGRNVMEALGGHGEDELRVVADVLTDVIEAVARATEEIKRDAEPVEG